MNIGRVLVTGAAGFIGSHTVDRLLRDGCEVIGVDDLSSGRLENLDWASKQGAFCFVSADITAPGRFEEICHSHRPGAIVHLAGLVSVVFARKNPELNFRLNLEATKIVAEGARRTEVRRIVFASSAAVYGDATDIPCRESALPAPKDLYGAAKSASEQLLLGYSHAFGMEAVCLRFFNVYGPRQDPSSPYSGVLSIFARCHSRGEPIRIYGDGTQTRDFISVFDVARATGLAATLPELPSACVNICTGRSTSLLEVAGALRELAPSNPDPEFAPARRGEILHSLGHPDRGRKILGFTAEIPIEPGLRALLAPAGDGRAEPTPSPGKKGNRVRA